MIFSFNNHRQTRLFQQEVARAVKLKDHESARDLLLQAFTYFSPELALEKHPCWRVLQPAALLLIESGYCISTGKYLDTGTQLVIEAPDGDILRSDFQHAAPVYA